MAAVAIRLLYCKLALDHVEMEQFALWPPDSKLYLALADHIISWHEMGGYALLRVGPGYGLILAGIKTIFGSNFIWPILFSIVMGGLAPVFVYLLAYQLFNLRAIALLAGGFGVVSLTSVTLSCQILTDQYFFTMHVAALVCFVRGYRTGRILWYVVAGLLAGYAAYIRPVGQFWPFIFIFLAFVVPLTRHYRSRRHFITRAGITGAVMLVMVLAWSARNYAVHDLFIFGSNGMLTVRQCLVAQVAAATRGENKTTWDYRVQWVEEDGDGHPELYSLAYNKAKARIIAELKASPRMMLYKYFRNFTDNMVVENTYVSKQIPQMTGFMRFLNRAVKKYLGWVIIVVTLTGLVTMVVRRQHLAAWLLGSTYVFFSVVLGGSFWQGSRLHYPAEMAWSIVVAYAVVLVFQRLRATWSERPARRAA